MLFASISSKRKCIHYSYIDELVTWTCNPPTALMIRDIQYDQIKTSEIQSPERRLQLLTTSGTDRRRRCAATKGAAPQAAPFYGLKRFKTEPRVPPSFAAGNTANAYRPRLREKHDASL
ncbi:hypothetical protein ACS0PU_004886 [Formica fusca]